MSLTYIQAISLGFPNVNCHSMGDGSIYSEIVWDGGSALPTQATLDAYIASYNPAAQPISVADAVQISPAAGNVLQVFNGNTWSTTITALSNLADVAVTTEITGQVLQYNGANWTNANVSASAQAGSYSAMPTAGNTGRLYIATDTDAVFANTGSKWINCSGPVSQVISSKISPKSSTAKVNTTNAVPTTSTGTLLWTLNVAPKYTSSTINISGDVFVSADAYGAHVSIGAFSNSTCLGVATNYVSGGGSMLGFTFNDTPATTANVTYTLRGWADGYWGAWYVATDSTPKFGGKLANNSVTITDINNK